MCIDRTGRYKVDDPGVGYKVFIRSGNGRLMPECQGANVTRPVRTWLRSRDFVYDSPYCPVSNPGWHIFPNKTEAKRWKLASSEDTVVRKVKYRKLLRIGYQQSRYGNTEKDFRVFTADEILILPEGK